MAMTELTIRSKKLVKVVLEKVKTENVTRRQALESLHRSVDCESFIGLKEKVCMWCSKPVYVNLQHSD